MGADQAAKPAQPARRPPVLTGSASLEPRLAHLFLSLTQEEHHEVLEPTFGWGIAYSVTLKAWRLRYVERLQRVDEAGQSGDLDDR